MSGTMRWLTVSVGLFQVWVSDEFVSKHLGEGSGTALKLRWFSGTTVVLTRSAGVALIGVAGYLVWVA